MLAQLWYVTVLTVWKRTPLSVISGKYRTSSNTKSVKNRLISTYSCIIMNPLRPYLHWNCLLTYRHILLQFLSRWRLEDALNFFRNYVCRTLEQPWKPTDLFLLQFPSLLHCSFFSKVEDYQSNYTYIYVVTLVLFHLTRPGSAKKTWWKWLK